MISAFIGFQLKPPPGDFVFFRKFQQFTEINERTKFERFAFSDSTVVHFHKLQQLVQGALTLYFSDVYATPYKYG